MLDRIKFAPRLAQVLFALVLSLEIVSFIALLQPAPLMRIFMLCALMFLTLGGIRAARLILIFLLSAGAFYLVLSGVATAASFGFKMFYYFFPATVLASTAAYLLLSKQFKIFLRTKFIHEAEPQNP